MRAAAEGRDGPDPGHTELPAAGAFVTLHDARGALRGCIGCFEGRGSLEETVVRMARESALKDPRFSPVRPEEVGDLAIEISVLGAPTPLSSPEALVVGVHGLIVEHGGARGVLLPQVAEELGWTRERFLEQVCEKARLDRQAWRWPETRLTVFTAEVFGDPARGTAES